MDASGERSCQGQKVGYSAWLSSGSPEAADRYREAKMVLAYYSVTQKGKAGPVPGPSW